MSIGRRLLLNTVSQYGMRGLAVLLSFVLVPFLIGKLGIEAFGLLVLIESFVQLSETALAGWRLAVARHATVSLSKGEDEDFKRYLAGGRAFFRGAAVLSVLTGSLTAWAAPVLIRMPVTLETSVRYLILFFTVSFALSMINSVYWAGLYAKERFDRINLSISGALVLRAVMIFALFTFFGSQDGFLLYGLVHLCATLAQNAAVLAAFRSLLPGVRLDAAGYRAKLHEILSFGSYTFLANSASALHDNVLVFFTNRLWGPVSNALYGVGSKFPDSLYLLLKEPAWALAPSLTALAGRGEKEKTERLFFFFTKSLALACVPACLVLGVFAKPILVAWAGPEFEASAPVMICWLASLALSAPFALCDAIPGVYGRVKVQAVACLIGVILALASAWMLAVSGWGLGGLAGGAAAVSVLYSTLFSVPYACRLTGISTRKFWFKAYLVPALFSVSVWSVFIGSVVFFGWAPLSIATSALAALFALFYIWAAFRWVLAPDETRRFLEVLQSFRR